MNPSPAAQSLLRFQIGPVQDFIAQARSTRDLWSGSYLLSFLVAAGIRVIPGKKEALIFPNPKDQPLLDDPCTWKGLPDQKSLLTPNLPNLFVARVPADQATIITDRICQAINATWTAIAKSVWNRRSELGIFVNETTFYSQANRHLSITWQVTPEVGSYLEDYGNNGWLLDAVRQTREFAAWGGGAVQVGGDKDSLNGRDAAVAGGKGPNGEPAASKVRQCFKHLFKHDDHLGAVALIKRVWHLTYLQDVEKLKTGSEEFSIRSTRAIAARDRREDDSENSDNSGAENYLAAIAFDGDSIGAWVSGDKLADKYNLRQHHADFSQCVSTFALQRARTIVEGDVASSRDGEFKGFLIYAGGDDVVALVPAEEAMAIAQQLRSAFREETSSIVGKEEREGAMVALQPDASAGIAIAHFKSPLQDLIREAQLAEKRAKNTVGRPAFSVALMKRSGEISHWGAKWDSGGIELYEAIATALESGRLSARFPHRVCQLLAPYLNRLAKLGRLDDATDFDAPALIRREFAFAISRQSTAGHAAGNEDNLIPKLDAYLSQLGKDPQTLLRALEGLCTTVAFAERNRTSPITPKGL